HGGWIEEVKPRCTVRAGGCNKPHYSKKDICVVLWASGRGLKRLFNESRPAAREIPSVQASASSLEPPAQGICPFLNQCARRPKSALRLMAVRPSVGCPASPSPARHRRRNRVLMGRLRIQQIPHEIIPPATHDIIRRDVSVR